MVINDSKKWRIFIFNDSRWLIWNENFGALFSPLGAAPSGLKYTPKNVLQTTSNDIFRKNFPITNAIRNIQIGSFKIEHHMEKFHVLNRINSINIDSSFIVILIK